MALPASDTFTAANGTDLTTHNSGWTQEHGSWEIQSNAAQCTTDAWEWHCAYWNADSFDDDQYSEYTVSYTNNDGSQSGGPASRVGAGLDGYGLISNGIGNVTLYRFDGTSSSTSLASGTGTPSNGDVWLLESEGSDHTAYLNASTTNQPSATDSTYSSGSAGFISEQDGDNFNPTEWEGGNLTSGPPIANGDIDLPSLVFDGSSTVTQPASTKSFSARSNTSGVENLANGGTIADISFDTDYHTDGTDITYSAGEFTLAAGIYLISYSSEFYTADTTNNERISIQTEIWIDDVAYGGFGHGYIRKTNGQQSIAIDGSDFLDISSESTLKIRAYRTDNSTSGSVDRLASVGGITIIKLEDANAFGLYEASGTTGINGTIAQVAINTTNREDTGLSLASNEITVTDAGQYVVNYTTQLSQAATSRLGLIGAIRINGTVYGQSSTMSYIRGADGNQDGGISWTGIVDLSASDTVDLSLVGQSSGAATAAAGTKLNIWKLPAAAETAIIAATGGDSNALGQFDFDTAEHTDSIFSYTNGEGFVTVSEAADLFVMGTLSKRADVENVQRATPRTRIAVDDVENSNYSAASYYRHSGSIGAIGHNVTGMIPVTTGQEVSLYETRLSTLTGAVAVEGAQLAILSIDSIYTPSSGGITASGDIDLPSLVFAGSASDSSSVITATADIDLPSLSFTGSATDSTSEIAITGDITLPSLSFTGSATDSTSEITATGTIDLPSLVFAGSSTITQPVGVVTLTGAIELPSLAFAGTATDSTSEVTASGDIGIPSLVFTGSATDSTSVVTVSGVVSLPSLLFSGDVTITDPVDVITIDGDISIPSLAFTGSATDTTSQVTLSGSVDLPSLAFSGSATDSTSVVTLSGDVLLPSLSFLGSATDSTSVVTVTGIIGLPSMLFDGAATSGIVTPDFTIIIDDLNKTIQTALNSTNTIETTPNLFTIETDTNQLTIETTKNTFTIEVQ